MRGILDILLRIIEDGLGLPNISHLARWDLKCVRICLIERVDRGQVVHLLHRLHSAVNTHIALQANNLLLLLLPEYLQRFDLTPHLLLRGLHLHAPVPQTLVLFLQLLQILILLIVSLLKLLEPPLLLIFAGTLDATGHDVGHHFGILQALAAV